MLILYDAFREAFDRMVREALLTRSYRHYSRDLMAALDYHDWRHFQTAVAAAQRALRTLKMPVEAHFKPVYVYDGSGIVPDYLLTDLACYFITINADPAYPAVARAQWYLLRRR